MKKLTIAGISLALLFTASTVFAIGMPKIKTGNSTVNKVTNSAVSSAKNKAIADDLNKDIAAYNCAFKDSSTTTETTCNLQQVIDKIKSKKSKLETLGLAKIRVYIKASGNDKTAYKRVRYIRDEMWGQMNYWHYNTNYSKNGRNDIAITFKVSD